MLKQEINVHTDNIQITLDDETNSVTIANYSVSEQEQKISGLVFEAAMQRLPQWKQIQQSFDLGSIYVCETPVLDDYPEEKHMFNRKLMYLEQQNDTLQPTNQTESEAATSGASASASASASFGASAASASSGDSAASASSGASAASASSGASAASASSGASAASASSGASAASASSGASSKRFSGALLPRFFWCFTRASSCFCYMILLVHTFQSSRSTVCL